MFILLVEYILKVEILVDLLLIQQCPLLKILTSRQILH